jgi:cell division protein FtsB
LGRGEGNQPQNVSGGFNTMKKAILVVVVLLPMLFLLSSCTAGVSQEEYDSLANDLTTAQAEYDSLANDLTTAQAEYDSLANDLTTAQAQIQSLQGQLEQGKARVEILNDIFIPAITGELFGLTEAESIAYFLEWRDNIIAIGDPELTSKFETMIETFSDQALTSFFVYLLESTSDTLE